jgi:hypothetical protein
MEQPPALRQDKLEVIHPKSGVKSSIVIHAPSPEEANQMAHAAGLMVGSIQCLDEQPAVIPVATAQRRAPAPPFSIAGVANFISWAWAALGICVTVFGVINLFLGDSIQARIQIGTGLFMNAIFAAYKWYWSDQGPWR